MSLKYLIPLIVLLTIPPVLGAIDPIEVNFEESGRVISFYEDYYVTNVNGNATIYNPSNTTFYNAVIPFSLQPMTIVEVGSSDYLNASEIIIPELGPFETVTFKYKIIGIPVVHPQEDGNSILHTAIIRYLRSHFGSDDPRLYYQIMGVLTKSGIENKTTGSMNTRVVSVGLKNPTSFEYIIDSVRVIKTTGMNPNPNTTSWLNEWQFPNSQQPKAKLSAYEEYHFDILDTNSNEGEVYWMTSNVYIPNIILTSNSSVITYTEKDILVFEGDESEYEENASNLTMLQQPLFIQKKVSKTIMQPGDEVDVQIIVTNLGFKSKEIDVRDVFPSGFSLLTTDLNVTDREINWRAKVPPGSPIILKYKLKYEDTAGLGIDYFPAAEMVWEDKTYFSQTLTFVRRYVPEKVLYLQKSLRYSVNDELVVKIELSNLGQAPLENVVLKDYLSSKDSFREISRVPYAKGVWKIPHVNAGETWEVTYVTNEHVNLNALPEVFGVQESMVMKSLLMENVIRSGYSFGSTNIMEFLGLALAVLLPILYVVLRRRQTVAKVKKADKMMNEISKLKDDTDIGSDSRIKMLLKDTNPPKPTHRTSHFSFHSRGKHELPQKQLHDISKNISDVRTRTRPKP